MSAYSLKRKPSGIYFVEFYEGDTRRRITTGSTDAKSARQRARDIVTGAAAPVPASRTARRKVGGMTMGQLLDRCCQTVWSPREVRSQRTVKSNAKILREMIGDVPVADMTYTRLQDLVQELFARGYAAGTVHRKMCAVSKALTEATMLTEADGRPVLAGKPKMPSVNAKNARDRVLGVDEEHAMFRAIAARSVAEPNRPWVRFAHLMRFLLDTGCRLGEALNVGVNDLKTRNSAVFVSFPRYTTKNEKPRELPLTTAIRQSLPHLRQTAVGGKLFPMKSQTVWYMFSTIRSELVAEGFAVSDVVLHTMRHTCLTRLARSGKVPLERISDWAGHSTLQVTMDHYRHMMPEDKLSTLDVIEEISSLNTI